MGKLESVSKEKDERLEALTSKLRPLLNKYRACEEENRKLKAQGAASPGAADEKVEALKNALSDTKEKASEAIAKLRYELRGKQLTIETLERQLPSSQPAVLDKRRASIGALPQRTREVLTQADGERQEDLLSENRALQLQVRHLREKLERHQEVSGETAFLEDSGFHG